jgi:hypothetical protein
MRAGGLGGGPGKMEESKRKHFSVSLAGSPTKPLTRAVGQPVFQIKVAFAFCSIVDLD